MRIDILTLFPEMFSPLEYSVIGRARQKGILEINIVDIRDFSADKHKKCDDYPFGGGAGMVMTRLRQRRRPGQASAENLFVPQRRKADAEKGG